MKSTTQNSRIPQGEINICSTFGENDDQNVMVLKRSLFWTPLNLDLGNVDIVSIDTFYFGVTIA